MGVLGIENRTENWKTARYFAPLFEDGRARLRLVERLLDEPADLSANETRIELFWRGMRDHLASTVKSDRDDDGFTERFRYLFFNLRSRVEEFSELEPGAFRQLKDWNYSTSTAHKTNLRSWDNESRRTQGAPNLANTEIDIVLESPTHLFIGEAKHEMGFHSISRLVLTHQLVRQYVMARLLLDRLGCEKAVVPFVVGDDSDKMRKPNQVKFMIWKGWLDERNVLEWDDISSLYV